MRIFADGDSTRQVGQTLAESLIVVGLIAAVAIASASAMHARNEDRSIDRVADVLLTDLKQMRLQAELVGKGVILEGRADGYSSSALGLSRSFPSHIVATWNDHPRATLAIDRPGSMNGAVILLNGSASTAVILIDAYTGEIRRE